MSNIDKTLSKGLAILQRMAELDHPAGVSELARSINLTKSNVHRLLQSLKMLGFVRQCRSSSAYELTPKLWELGSAYISRTDVHSAALEHMHSIARTTSETVHLSILDQRDVIYIGKIDSPLPIGTYSRLGGRAPAHAVATGKAILAFQTFETLENFLSEPLKPYTKNTLVEKSEFVGQLERVRANGYATNKGEWSTSVHGVAAPVWNSKQEVCAAIGITGPAERMHTSSLLDFVPIVVQAADVISRNLGYIRRH